MQDELSAYKEKVQERLNALKETFALAALGDFSHDVLLHDEEDEFTETFVGVQIMIEVIRDALRDMRKELAERAALEKRKDEFIAILGHELRNPLAPIVYATELLKLGLEGVPKAEELQYNLSVIERQSTHMKRLISDLLDVSRLMHDKIALQKRPLDLCDVLESSAQTMQPFMQKKKQFFSVEWSSDVLSVEGDPLRLEQIMTNLLSNATRYTPENGTISLSTEIKDGFVHVIVGDTGIGIGDDFLPNIFDPFSQQKVGTGEGGLGMGLAIARGFARLHGGDVMAKSCGDGKGSEFTLALPLSTISPVSCAPELVVKDIGRKRVLIVDDNADLARAVGTALERYGHAVVVALDGRTALASIDTFTPDAVLLDLAMPEMDGFDVIKELRRHPNTKSTRIIALTGFGQASDFDRTKAAGFDSHLVKPPQLNALIEAIAGDSSSDL